MMKTTASEVWIQYKWIVALVVVAVLLKLGWIDFAFLDWAGDTGVRLIEASKQFIGGG